MMELIIEESFNTSCFLYLIMSHILKQEEQEKFERKREYEKR